MEIIVGDIPGKALFYKEYGDERFEVKIQLKDGRIIDPMYGYRPNSQEEKFEVERYFEDLLPYVNDVKIKRLLIENLIMDAHLDIDAYMEELSTASSEELAKTWEPRDPSKWWTMLYPTRGELLKGNMNEVQRSLKRYEQMLRELLHDK